MSIQHVLDKVRKLRALATSANAHEAAAAAAAADRLIQEHRLHEAEIEASGVEPDEAPEEHADPLYRQGARRVYWIQHLAGHLCRAYSVAPYLYGSTYRMVGRKSDVETVRYLFAAYSADVERLAIAYSPGSWESPRTARRSFREGVVAGIAEAVGYARTSQRRREAAGDAASLVLASRTDQAKAELDRLHPKLGSGPTRSTGVSRDAYGEGVRAGRDLASREARAALGTPSRMLGPKKTGGQ